jgi:hypothetical protein
MIEQLNDLEEDQEEANTPDEYCCTRRLEF